MSNYIRFETNKPVVTVLKALTGETVDGQFGQQVILETADSRSFYASEALLTKIHHLGVAPGEPIRIQKREMSKGNRKWIEWDVQREGSAPRSNSETMRHMREQQAAAPDPAPQPKPAAPLGSSNLMAAAVMQAIDAVAAGEAHAKSLGMTFKFTEQHISSLACTVYIQHSKLLGGNTTWQQ